MSVDYRHLPPVEPVEPQSRFSMTTIQRDDQCPRSAYLGVKYRNGPSSHEMDRGSLFHAAVEQLMKDLIVSGEPALAPDDPTQAAAMTAAIVDEVLRARPDLVVPRAEVDNVREMLFHVACGYDVDPETIAGLEMLLVLDLECGWTVSGRVDLLALPSAELGQVDDWKSGRAMVSQDEYERKTQPWMYAVLVLFGTPVVVTPCEGCAHPPYFLDADGVVTPLEGPCTLCGGKGHLEERGEPGALGAHLRGLQLREVYPHAQLRDDGTLHRREMLLSRTAIADFRDDLERMAERLGERFESWDFPARAGSWCSMCPAPSECPLPEHLRDHAGTVNSVEQAEEAWEKVLLVKAQVAAIEKEIKTFARAHDVPIRVGDLEWRWQMREGRAVRKVGGRSDWDGLEAAVVEAAEFGTPFRVSEFVVPTAGSEFKKSKVNTNGETR